MTVLNRRSAAADHRRHDRLLVARFAAGDSPANEIHEARALLAACTECAALAADLRLLPSALRMSPVPRRPRDFRLTAEQADGLRGSRLDRALRGLAASGWTTLRPVAGVALSLGLVLAVVGALPVGLPASEPGSFSAQGPETVDTTLEAPPAEELAPAGPHGAGEPVEPDARDAQATSALGADPFSNSYLDEAAPGEGDERLALEDPAAPTRDWMIYAGLALAAAALGLLSLAWVARRRFADPLLR